MRVEKLHLDRALAGGVPGRPARAHPNSHTLTLFVIGLMLHIRWMLTQ
jgi:hypothetical protein